MAFIRVLWDDEDDPDGNVQHIAAHDLTTEDVEHVISYPTGKGVSRSSGLPTVWGYTDDDRYIMVVYRYLNRKTVRVITAYEVPARQN